MPAGRLAAPLALVLAAIMCCLAACSQPAEPSPSPTTPSPPSTASPPPSATSPVAPSDGDTVPIDPDLLDALPEEVEGIPLLRTDEALTDVVGDSGLLAFADAVAAGLVLDQATGDFAYATVVRPRVDPVPDEVFRDWRSTYDEGVCAQAGGVAGIAEAEVGGRPTFIGTCAGGVRTYHVLLGNRGLLVSVSATGERRLGERLVEGLRD